MKHHSIQLPPATGFLGTGVPMLEVERQWLEQNKTQMEKQIADLNEDLQKEKQNMETYKDQLKVATQKVASLDFLKPEDKDRWEATNVMHRIAESVSFQGPILMNLESKIESTSKVLEKVVRSLQRIYYLQEHEGEKA
jgi:uncharacterized coiled-coil protein SlyX